MNRFYSTVGLYVWDSQLGNTIYFTDWIFRLSLFPFSFLSGEILTKGMLIFVVTLSGYGAYCLGRRLGLSTFSSFAAGILFIFSPIVFTRIVAGHIYYLIAYFLSPLILSCFLKGKEDIDEGEEQKRQQGKSKNKLYNNNDPKNKIKINHTNYKYFIIAGLLTSVAIIQIQFVVMIFIILLVFTFIDFKNIKRSALGLIIVFSITFLVNLSPIVLSQTMVKAPISFFTPVQLLSYHEISHASNLTKSLRLLGYEEHSYSYINLGTRHDPLVSSNKGIIPPWIFYLDFLLPIVGFSALLFRRKDKYTLSFAVISLIGLFLMKGLNPPFPSIFSFLFIHGFFIFRELWHVSFLYGFGMSFLIAFFLEKVIARRAIITTLTTRRITPITTSFKQSPKYHNYSAVRSYRKQHSRNPFHLSIASALSSFLSTSFASSSSYKILKNYYKVILSSFFVCLIVISNGYPLLIGNFGGYLQTYNFPNEYHTLYNNFLTNSTYNTLILPLFSPIRFDGLKVDGIDPLVLDSANNIFEQLTFNLPFNPLTGVSTWLLSVMQQNTTNTFGKLLSGFGIKYVVLRKDFVSNYPRYNDQGSYTPFLTRWYSSLEPFLNTQKDLVVIANTSHYKIYENTNDAKKIFIPPTLENGLSDFRDLIYISNFTSLANVGVYPVDKNTPYYDFIPLGQFATSSDAREGWTTNRDWFGYNYLLASRVNVGALTISNISKSPLEFELTLPPKYQNKPIELWMKAFTWNRGGMVNININGKESSYNLNSTHDGFSLIKIYDENRYTYPNYSFLIRNIVGQNYIEGIYVKERGIERNPSSRNEIFIAGIQDENNLVVNPDFRYATNQSRLPLYWNDSPKNCEYFFKCTTISTDKWKNNTSFLLSTNITSKRPVSSISGAGIDVTPDQTYQLTTHMKLNQYATKSHVAIEAYNQTSKKWNQLRPQCPTGTNGPLEWHAYTCEIAIPRNITKIRPVLYAGWSSQSGKEAVTLFSDIGISLPNVENRVQNLVKIEQLPGSLSELSQGEIRRTSELNPTLWNVHINNASKPFVLSFVESYDPSWEARIYKDGKKVDTVNSTPLYGSINAFQVNQTGNNLDIQLRYTRQDWFEIGMYISAIALAFCVLYILYDWSRARSKKMNGQKKLND